MTTIPLTGGGSNRSGSFNPTLLPNFDLAIASGGGTVDWVTPADYLAANPRSDAQATATIGGSVSIGDQVTLIVNNPIFANERLGGLVPAQLSHTYTTVSGDTVTTVAEALADLFNDDALGQQVGLRADVTGAVITFHWNGPVGNSAVLSSPLDQPSTITVGGAALTNDQLNVLFVGPALAVLANAQEIATVGGTVAAGNTAALTFTNSGVSGLPVTKTYTCGAADTPTTIAAGLVLLINADATLAAAGITAYSDNAVITVLQQGAIGNNTVLTRAVTGSVTVTFGNGGDLAGGKGAVGQTNVLVQYATTTGQTASQMATALAAAITANPVLTALSISAAAVGAKITMTIPAAAEPISSSGWVNTIAPKATITGGVAAADVINVTITSAAISGGSATVSYTALLGDTTTSIATGLKNAVNANAALIAAGITATSSTNQVTFLYQAASGAIRFSSSVSPGSETVTLSTSPTETLFFSTSGTEMVTVGNGATAVVAATAVATVGGTGAAAATVALTFTNAGVTGLPVTETYTCVGTDSAATIAAALAVLVNTDPVLQAAGITAAVSSAVITISHQGTIGNTTVLTTAATGGGSAAITFTPSNGHLSGGAGVTGGIFSGGAGPVIPFNNFPFMRGGVISHMRAGQPEFVDPPSLTQMVHEANSIV